MPPRIRTPRYRGQIAGRGDWAILERIEQVFLVELTFKSIGLEKSMAGNTFTYERRHDLY